MTMKIECTYCGRYKKVSPHNENLCKHCVKEFEIESFSKDNGLIEYPRYNGVVTADGMIR